VEATARAQPAAAGPIYSRRQPEKTALYKVIQEHLLTFEREWTDTAGRTLPKFVTDELHGYLDCGILAQGCAHLYCESCGEHFVVGFSCKGRAVCPSCLGRRMSEGAAHLVDDVLPEVPIRQFVVTMPFPLRFPLAFDGKLLGQILRIFTDTVAKWYRERHVERGLPDGETGAVTAIQRANSDLRLSPHFHTLFLDGVYSADREGKGRMFHPAPAPSQEEIEQLVEGASKRILRFLERRGVITLVTAPGDGELTLVTDETLAEKDLLLAKLLAAATAGVDPAGPASKRQPIRIVLDPDERPVTKGALCGQTQGFNLQAATRVAANDKQGRERLCRYILRPPLANDRLSILDEGNVRLDFKRPWSNGTSSVVLAPLALITRLAALVPPPRRHTVLYCGVLSSHASSRKEVVPAAPEPAPPHAGKDKPKRCPKYIRWSDLLRRVFGIETICPTCQTPLRLISLIKSEPIAKKILIAMHLPAEAPELHPARPPPGKPGSGEDWVN
jgi:hypothetical protein